MDLLSGLRKGDSSRGGRADFKWEDVKEDKDRENYLGHSLMAPVGRWQKGKDLTWYAKANDDDKIAAEEARKEEIRRIKEAEQDALSEALGFKVVRHHQDPVSDAEVRKAIKEAGGAEGGEEEEEEGRGIGFGKSGGIKGLLRHEEGARVTTDDGVQVDAGYRPARREDRRRDDEPRDKDGHKSRRTHHGRSRSRERRRDGSDRDRERRHRRRSSRSRSRRRRDRADDGDECRRHRSRDRGRRYDNERRGRDRSRSPRRDYERRR